MNRERREIIRLMAEIFHNEKDPKAKEELNKKLDIGLNEEEKVYLSQILEGLSSGARI